MESQEVPPSDCDGPFRSMDPRTLVINHLQWISTHPHMRLTETGMQPDFLRLQSPSSQKNVRKMFAIKAHKAQIHRAASGI